MRVIRSVAPCVGRPDSMQLQLLDALALRRARYASSRHSHLSERHSNALQATSGGQFDSMQLAPVFTAALRRCWRSGLSKHPFKSVLLSYCTDATSRHLHLSSYHLNTLQASGSQHDSMQLGSGPAGGATTSGGMVAAGLSGKAKEVHHQSTLSTTMNVCLFFRFRVRARCEDRRRGGCETQHEAKAARCQNTLY